MAWPNLDAVVCHCLVIQTQQFQCPRSPTHVNVFKDQEENKHEAQGRKFVYFSQAILTFGNRKALGKVLLDKETFENYTLCNLQE